MKTAPPTAIERVATEWLLAGRRVVVAVLVERLGSAPLDPGAQMLFDDEGNTEGSVTGGCIEAALYEEAQVILSGGPAKLLDYGISDEDATGVGLMCGGSVKIFLHELASESTEVVAVAADALHAGRPVAVATLLDGDRAGAKIAVLDDSVIGGFGVTELLDHSVAREARGFIGEGISCIRHYGAGGEVLGSELSVFIRAHSTSPQMIIFGAVDFAAEVAHAAGRLGYLVTICDARASFVSSPRFSRSAHVVVDWPDRFLAGQALSERDAVLVFTHDPKFDEPALVAALGSGAGYIGAMGSRRTHEQRVDRLRRSGLPESDIERIHSPCGLDIGARTPAETAISVLAEVIAHRSDRSGLSLTETSGPIHSGPRPENPDRSRAV